MVGRGDTALGVALAVGVPAGGDGVGAFGENGAVFGFQPDEFPAVLVGHVAAQLGALAEEVMLLLRDCPVEAKILRDHRAIGFVADHDEALFGPHDVQGLGAVGHDAEGGTGPQERLPEGEALGGGDGDFVREFAGEGDPEDAGVEVPDLAFRVAHEGKRFGRKIHPAKGFQHVPRVRTDDGDLGPLLGHIGGVDLPVPPFGLEPFLHVPVDPVRTAGGGVAEPGFVIEPDDDAVVDQKPVFRAHEPVAAAARGEGRHHVGVHHVEEPARIGAADDDLAERGSIKQANGFAGVLHLALDGVMNALARAQEGVGAAPVTHRLPMRAVGFVPAVDRGPAEGLEDLAPRFARDGAHGDGRVGRAEGGGSRLGDRLTQFLRKDREAVDIRRFSLIGGHAERGVALGVLDALVPFAGGKLDVRHLHVVLVVEPHLGPVRVVSTLRHDPDREHGSFVGIGPLGGGPCPALVAGGLGGRYPGVAGRGQGCGGAEEAVGGACNTDHGAAVGPGGGSLVVGAEHGLGLVPAELAAGVRPEVDDRGPAARHGDGVAGQFLGLGASARLGGEEDAIDLGMALDLADGRAGFDADAAAADLFGERAGGFGAGVDHGLDLKPRIIERDGGAVGVVVVGDDDSPIAGGDAPVHQIVADRRGEHDAGKIIAGEGQRAFDGACGRDDLLCTDLPEPVARPPGVGIVIGEALVGQRIAVVIDARAHGAGADADLVHGKESFDRFIDPCFGRLAVDLGPVHGRAAAPMGGLLDQEHLGAGFGGRLGRLEPGDAATDHQNVRVGVEVFVGVHVPRHGDLAEPGGLADERFVDMLPEDPGVEEHLVVEARGQETGEVGVDGAHVEFEARPVVLASRGEALEQLLRCGALVGFEPPLGAEVHERVGLFRARGDDAPGAMVLEGPADEFLTVGQKRRGQGVAGHARHAFAVEGEVEGERAVDEAAAFGKPPAHGSISRQDQPLGCSAVMMSRISSGGSVVCAG